MDISKEKSNRNNGQNAKLKCAQIHEEIVKCRVISLKTAESRPFRGARHGREIAKCAVFQVGNC